MTPKFNFTDEEMEAITSYTAKTVKNIDSSKSVKKNVVETLKGNIPGITDEIASTLAAQLIKGVTDFSSNYTELCKQENPSQFIYDRCMEHIKYRTLHEQAVCILNFIAVLKTLDATVLGDMLADANSDILTKFDEFKSGNPQVADDITEEDITQLKQQLHDSLDNNSVCMAGDKQIEEIVDTLDPDPELSKALLDKKIKDIDYKVYAALAAYITYKNGAIPSLPKDVDPELLGASVAAGVERGKVIDEAKRGLISWNTAYKLIKFIGGALLLFLFVWVDYHIFVAGVAATIGLLSGMMGVTTLSLIAGLVIGTFAMYKVLTWFFEKVECPIMQSVGDAYEKVIDYFSKPELIKHVKESFKSFWTYITSNITLLFKSITGKDKVNVTTE